MDHGHGLRTLVSLLSSLAEEIWSTYSSNSLHYSSLSHWLLRLFICGILRLTLTVRPSTTAVRGDTIGMRLLDTNTGHFVEKDPKNTKYATLSHTWDKQGEQTYKQFRKIQKRYEPHPGSSAIPRASGSHPSPNPSVSGMTPTASTPAPNESTPLLLPDRLSLLEQGIPQGHSKVDSESRFTHLQRFILHWVTRLWESLVLLLVFAFPRRFIQAIPSNLFLSAQLSDASISQDRAHVRELSSRDPPELAHVKASPRSIWDDPELSPKIRQACAIARANGYQYIWIDSCCIDQSSSSELSEAINSMYAWYTRSHVCYAYLADVPAGEDHRGYRSRFRQSRWFGRGWTLQELIAPLNVVFLCQDWSVIGPKYAFSDLVQEITGVSEEAVLHVESLGQFSVAQRLSWASGRWTTRTEDRAYSLLGIFDINMPTLYGEGTRAFRRLQEEIMRRLPDQSLFAWGEIYLGSPVLGSNTITAEQKKSMKFSCRRNSLESPSLVANMPTDFRKTQSTVRSAACLDIVSRVQLEYTSSPYGIRTQFQMIPLSLLPPPRLNTVHDTRNGG
ncbi:HET-domain-containing protein [Ganoderma leucocontextum]|nr:HET-domain-containing protein [Ganoderma leucocontextum]